MLVIRDGRAKRERIIDRHIDHCIGFAAGVIAQLCAGGAFQLFAWGIGDHIDHACGGVAAIQSALRATQYFNPVQIEKTEVLIERPRNVDAIEHKCGRRIALGRGVCARYATNRDTHAAARIIDFDVRNARAQAGRLINPGTLKLFAREAAHRHRSFRCQ